MAVLVSPGRSPAKEETDGDPTEERAGPSSRVWRPICVVPHIRNAMLEAQAAFRRAERRMALRMALEDELYQEFLADESRMHALMAESSEDEEDEEGDEDRVVVHAG